MVLIVAVVAWRAVVEAARLPPPQPPPDGFRVVGYWPWWTERAAADLPASGLTAVVWFAAGLDASGRCVLDDVARTRAELEALADLRDDHPHLRVLAAVATPWNSVDADAALATPEGRARVADSCVSLLVDGRLPDGGAPLAGVVDGIDLDWEFPSADERQHVTALLAALRERLGPGRLLTVAVPAWPEVGERFDLAAVAATVDWIHLMAYDLAPWNAGVAGFPAPLSGGPRAIDAVVTRLRRAGVPTGSIVVGVPGYATVWADVPAPGRPGAPTSGRAEATGTGWLVVRDGPVLAVDPEAQQAWRHDPVSGQLTVTDTPATVRAKAAFVAAEGLGGVMLWHLGMDTGDAELVRAAGDGLREAGGPVQVGGSATR